MNGAEGLAAGFGEAPSEVDPAKRGLLFCMASC